MSAAEKVDGSGKLTRRKIVALGAAGFGLAALGFGIPQDAHASPQVQEGTPEQNTLFRFDADSQITQSDWEGIFAYVEYKRNNPLPHTVGVAKLKYNISLISREQSEKVILSEDDWQQDRSGLEYGLKNDLPVYIMLPDAAAVRAAYPEKKDELYTILDPFYDGLVQKFQLVKAEEWETYFLPEIAFSAQFLYPEGEDDFRIGETRNSVEKLMSRYRTDGKWDALSDMLPHAKHIYQGIMSEYNDAQTTQGLQESFTSSVDNPSSLDNLRSVRAWPEFTRRAGWAELLEANSVQMTPQGLVLS
ncbi:MAG: hypothetical protein HY431_01205 [Candidatus Levybacteria bacterium]|nr:hypothetical protein [Candidatus Levybacteria bacterium]